MSQPAYFIPIDPTARANLQNTVAQLVKDIEDLKSFRSQSDKILTVDEAATFINIHPKTIRRKIRIGKIKAIPIDSKKYGIYKSELTKYLNR